jgi:hypothetical protein
VKLVIKTLLVALPIVATFVIVDVLLGMFQASLLTSQSVALQITLAVFGLLSIFIVPVAVLILELCLLRLFGQKKLAYSMFLTEHKDSNGVKKVEIFMRPIVKLVLGEEQLE